MKTKCFLAGFLVVAWGALATAQTVEYIPLSSPLSKLPSAGSYHETLARDNGVPRLAWFGATSWAVRFSANVNPEYIFHISGASVGIWSRSGGEVFSLSLWDDLIGYPYCEQEIGTFSCFPGAYIYEITIPQQLFDSDDFWLSVTLDTQNDPISGLYILADDESPNGTSCFLSDQLLWEPLPTGNLCIRASGEPIGRVSVGETWRDRGDFDVVWELPASISFALPYPAYVDVNVYDSRGRCVSRLLAGVSLEAGEHEVDLGIEGMGPGVYFVAFSADHGALRSILKVPLLH
jgi:hypothetical protein